MRKMNLPKNVVFIIDRLNKGGYRADVVGGAVRDFLIERPSGDYDITTSATPEKTKEIFSDKRTIDTGIKHGTVSILLDGVTYEVTTYRRDGEYLDNRHPAEVTFTDELALDLARRDFTMNAICYNDEDGFTDLYGGLDDIKAGIIRTVGDANKRFNEDALRILRAIRFSSELGFMLEEKTHKAVIGNKSLLQNISRERILVEFRKLLSGAFAYRVLKEYEEVIKVFVPEITKIDLKSEDKFTNSDGFTRLLMIFAPLGYTAPSSFSSAMHSLKSDTKTIKTGEKALEGYNGEIEESEKGVLRLLRSYGKEVTLEIVKLGVSLDRFSEALLEMYFSVIESGAAYSLRQLKINGGDLISVGFRGEGVGSELDRLLGLVIEGECKNDKELLLAESVGYKKKCEERGISDGV